jgi:hypothetical protein
MPVPDLRNLVYGYVVAMTILHNRLANAYHSVNAHIKMSLLMYRITSFLGTLLVLCQMIISYYLVPECLEMCFIPYFCDMGLNYQLDPYLFNFMCIFFTLSYILSHFTKKRIFRICFIVIFILLTLVAFYNSWCYFYYMSATDMDEMNGKVYLYTMDRKWNRKAFSISTGRAKHNDHHNYTYNAYSHPYSVKLDTSSSLLKPRFLSLLNISNDRNITEMYISPVFPNHLFSIMTHRHIMNLRNMIFFIPLSLLVFLMNFDLLFFRQPNI